MCINLNVKLNLYVCVCGMCAQYSAAMLFDVEAAKTIATLESPQ